MIEIDGQGNVIVPDEMAGTFKDIRLGLHGRLLKLAEVGPEEQRELILNAADRIGGADSAIARRAKTQEAIHNTMNILRQDNDSLRTRIAELEQEIELLRGDMESSL